MVLLMEMIKVDMLVSVEIYSSWEAGRVGYKLVRSS